MDIEKKEKVKNIIKNVWLGISTFLSVCFVVVCAVACSSGSKQQTNNNSNNVNEVIRQENKKFVNSDYSHYIDALEYEMINFKAYLRSIDSDISTLFADSYLYDVNITSNQINVGDYNSFEFYEFDGEMIVWSTTYDNAIYYIKLDILAEESNYFNLQDEGDYITPSELIFGLSVNESISFDVFNALDFDLDVIPQDIIGHGGIFENMTNSITAFIGSLSSGITAMVGIFYSNGALTIIGLLSVIVVAITLSYFLFRLFIGLIRMRG